MMSEDAILPVKTVLKELGDIVDTLSPKYQTVCQYVMGQGEASGFYIHPASLTKHHTWNGGLAQHTLELCQYAVAICDLAKRVNRDVVLTACVWHDYGKLWDSVWSPVHESWVRTEHFKLVYHLQRSFSEWMEYSRKNGFYDRESNAVGHCILAHHGRKEWGSPIEPKTPEAWIVHQADMNSVYVLHDRKSK